jgi:hypothetical protein
MRSAIETCKQNHFTKKECKRMMYTMFPMNDHRYIDKMICEVYGNYGGAL